MQFLSGLFDLMVLNFITLILCVPIVTAVPAIIALHYMTLRMVRGEQTYLLGPYFKSFKSNFIQGFLIGLIFIVGGAIFAIDIRGMLIGDLARLSIIMRIMMISVMIVIVLLFSWVIPLQSHFVNALPATFNNSIFLAIANFPRTLGMTAVWVVPVVIAVASYTLWPIVILFGLSIPAYLSAMLYSPVFRRFEPAPEEEPAPDEQFSMDEGELDAFAQDLHEMMGEQEDK